MTTSRVPQADTAKKAAAAIKAKNELTRLEDQAILEQRAQAQVRATIKETLAKFESRGPRGKRPPAPPPFRLMSKPEVLAIAGVTYPASWAWMRDGLFPRARVVGKGNSSRSFWRSDEVEAWLAELPTRRLKGDGA